MEKKVGDVQVTDVGGHVALVEIQRGPNNFFDEDLIRALADVFLELDEDPSVRASVLASAGKHFCAGANFSAPADSKRRVKFTAETGNPLYQEAVRLFHNKKYVVAAVQGAAVGGGFGLSMFPDFRVGCAQSRFTANFVKLGFTPGFGLTRVLPRLIGQQAANDLFATGRRVDGQEALKLGIIDRLVPQDEVRAVAIAYAQEIAENAPLALLSVRQSVRGDLAQLVQAATDHEGAEQFHLQQTKDYKEGVKAVAERRPGRFLGE
ncbi:MAG: enoyl-CoA hydratase/isomerase family protein [Gammaproteobacteria bacterium]|jgi:enoyl-CoA hydratase/carnithine racemase|nr:enoyl-CoA hydratase/isomerase family protein [Gammaproteobacteria bacterium]